MQVLAFYNLSSGELTSTLDGGALALPPMVAGGTLAMKLRLSQQVAGAAALSSREVSTLKAGLGLPDARPATGEFNLHINGGTATAGVNLTGLLQWNASDDQWAAAINALSGLGGLLPCTVKKEHDTYLIRFADAEAVVDIESTENKLRPASFVNLDTYLGEDNAIVHAVRLTQAPVTQVTTFGLIVPEPPTVVEIQEGGEEGGVEWNAIQKVKFPPDFRGAFQFKRGFRRTKPIGLPTNADELAEALKAVADDGGVFELTEEQDAALIEFGGSMAATDQPLLEIVVFDPPPGDILITLPTDKAEVYRLLDRLADARTGQLKLPLEITLKIPNEQTPANLDTYIIQQELVLLKPINTDARNAAVEVNWNQPPSRTRFTPFGPGQISVGQRHHNVVIGNGSATIVPINHNLGTKGLHVTVAGNTDGGQRVADNTYTLEYTNDNTITLTFTAAPALNSLAVFISTAVHSSNFQAHEHTTGEIINLDTILAGLGTDIAELQDLLGIGVIGADVPGGTTVPVMTWMLPPFALVYPTRETPEGMAELDSLVNIPIDKLPRRGGLLPAIHDAAVEDLPDPLPTVDATYEGRVFQNNTSAAVTLPGGMGRRSVKLKVGQYAAVLFEDNRVSWYRVAKMDASKSSWYPTDFIYQLFSFSVNEKQLRVGKKLTVQIGIELALLLANTKAQWRFVIEHGTKSEVTETAAVTVTPNEPANTLTSAGAVEFQDGQRVKIASTIAVPAPLVAGTVYFVRDHAAGVFKLAATSGGAAINLTDVGSGVITVKGVPDSNVNAVVWDEATPILAQILDLDATAAVHQLGCVITRTAEAITATAVLYGSSQAGGSAPATANFYLRGRLVQFDTEDSEPDPEGFVAVRGPNRSTSDAENPAIGTAIITSI